MNPVLAAVVWIIQQDPTTTSGASNVPQPVPDPSGFPGQDAVETLLDIASWAGVVAALAAVILGGAAFAFGHGSANAAIGGRGRTWILGGLAGGLIVAMSGQLISFMVGLQ